MKRYWLTCCVVCLAIGGCCGSAICDEPTLQAAKSQLNAAPNPLDAIKKLTESTSTTKAEETAIDTHPPQVVEVLPEPSITFQQSVTTGSSGLIKTTRTVTEHWLVSEPWCSLCPAAKARFLRLGRKQSNIIDRAEAKRRHGKNVSGVPFEYTTNETIETAHTVSTA